MHKHSVPLAKVQTKFILDYCTVLNELSQMGKEAIPALHAEDKPELLTLFLSGSVY